MKAGSPPQCLDWYGIHLDRLDKSQYMKVELQILGGGRTATGPADPEVRWSTVRGNTAKLWRLVYLLVLLALPLIARG